MENMNHNNFMWVERHRPRDINNIIQSDIKQLITSKNDLSDLTHLLFSGPSGTGKTSTALTICKHIFTSNPIHSAYYKKILGERVLELNASDERGIKVVREKIKTFASLALNNYVGVPAYKIIILDEADVMTNETQFALRRIMEQYSRITRFILICNYVSKIIPPLASRCSKYNFKSVDINIMKSVVENILIKESVNYDVKHLDNIILELHKYSNGDLRKTITLLQRSAYLSNLNNIMLDNNLIIETASQVPDNIILCLLDILMKNDNIYCELKVMINNILNNGFSSSDVLDKLSTKILSSKNITDEQKSMIFIKMSEINNLLSTGSGGYIQLLTICSFINHTISC
jgi:replication factor C subunit 2/4